MCNFMKLVEDSSLCQSQTENGLLKSTRLDVSADIIFIYR